MRVNFKTLLASAAIGLALTACKGAEDVAHDVTSTASKITLPAGITKIESVGPAKGDQVVIPYTKYSCLLYTSPSPRDRG